MVRLHKQTKAHSNCGKVVGNRYVHIEQLQRIMDKCGD